MNEKKTKEKVPPPVFSGEPSADLEKKLREHPDDLSTRIDVGSDESMDASDPPSSARSGDEPAPSSSFPDEETEDSDRKA